MDDAAAEPGVEGFLAGLRRCGLDPVTKSGVVTFDVTPCHGALAGQRVQSGVAVAELAMWPAAPPHWIHLPAVIHLSPTNINTEETLAGWVRHSRQVTGWGDAAEPAQAWLAHVRSVLESAVRGAA